MSHTNGTFVDGWEHAIEEFLYDYVDEHDLPSVAATVVSADGERHSVAFGSRRLDTNDPATPDTLYGIGSVTKSFTALAVMQQVESGRLDLEASPAKYTDLAFDGAESVTLHDLLCHGSGLPSLAVSEALIARQADIGEASVPLGDRDDFYHFINGAGSERTEAGRFMYCNSGYMVLADAVSAVADRPFHEVVQRDILDPLGMERSTMEEDRFQTDANTMTPYRRGDDDAGWDATPVPVRDLSRGPGGLFASTRELGRYLMMYLNDGVAVDGTRVLDQSSIEAMIGGYTQTPAGPYGYGWRTRDVFSEQWNGHSGSIGVSTAYAGWSPGLDIGVAVAANAAPGHRLAYVGEAIAAITTGIDPDEHLSFFAREERHQQLSGEYTSYRDVRTARVEPAGGTLQLTLIEPMEGASVTLIYDKPLPDGHRYWTPTDEDGRLTVDFIIDDDGVSLFFERWHLHQRS